MGIKFHEAKRHAVYARDGYCCAYCGIKDSTGSGYGLTVDHVKARDLGGALQLGVREPADNLVTACGSCNSTKQKLTPREFSKYAAGIGPPPNSPPDWDKVRARTKKKIDIEDGAKRAEYARKFREQNSGMKKAPTREEMEEFGEEHAKDLAAQVKRHREAKAEIVREHASNLEKTAKAGKDKAAKEEEPKKAPREKAPEKQGPGIQHDPATGQFT